MKRAFELLLLFPALFLLAGCYGAKLVRGPITTEENAAEIGRLREGQAAAERRLVALEESSEEEVELLRAIRAELAAGMDEISGRVEAVEARLGESADRVERVEGKLDRVQYRLGREAPVGEEAPPESSAVVIDPKPLFDSAYLDLLRGSYRAALAGFESYLAAYPRSALSDDARYWIGECYLAEGEPREAADHFARVEKDYPGSERIPASLLKLATCRIELGEKGEARKVLTRIIDTYPDAVEAPLAKEKLEETN